MGETANIRLLQQAIACFDDVQAYKQLFLLFYSSLRQFAFTILRSKELSEEIVSDVFIKIWEKRQQLDKIDNLRFYLFTAVKNRAITCVTRQKKNVVEPMDETMVEFKSIYHDPEQKMISAEMIARIHDAIHKLPPRCQLVFKLVKEDGLSYREVAELLHLSPKTVENQISLALKKIGSAVHLHLHPLASFSEN